MQQKISVTELCTQLEKELIGLHYNQDSLYRYRKVLKEFKDFTGDVDFSTNLTSDFIQFIMKRDSGFSEKGEHSKKHLYYVRTMRKLEDYLMFRTFFRTKKTMPPASWPEGFSQGLDTFFSEYRDGELSELQYRRIRKNIQRFILYLTGNGFGSFTEVRYPQITGYISSLVGYAPVTIASDISCLRVVFRYLYLNQFIYTPLHDLLPKVHNVWRTKIPNVWSEEELIRIKSVIDLGNPVGKRDFAIILLAAGTGLRAGDIASLKLQDIDWEKKELSVVQNKTKGFLKLPLMDDVGWAIINYLKDARPETDSGYLFVRLNFPFEPYVSSPQPLYRIITGYIGKAGIKTEGRSKIGIHSLRHTIANTLLNHNVGITTIADILGHSSPETTLHYLRSSMEALSRCPLEVMSSEE